MITQAVSVTDLDSTVEGSRQDPYGDQMYFTGCIAREKKTSKKVRLDSIELQMWGRGVRR